MNNINKNVDSNLNLNSNLINSSLDNHLSCLLDDNLDGNLDVNDTHRIHININNDKNKQATTVTSLMTKFKVKGFKVKRLKAKNSAKIGANIGSKIGLGMLIGLSSQYLYAQSPDPQSTYAYATKQKNNLQQGWSFSSNLSTISTKLASFRAEPIDRPIKIITPKVNLNSTANRQLNPPLHPTSHPSLNQSLLSPKIRPQIKQKISPTIKSATSPKLANSKPTNTNTIKNNRKNSISSKTKALNVRLKPLTQYLRQKQQSPSVSVSSQINIISSKQPYKPFQNSANPSLSGKVNADISDKERQMRLQNNRDVLAQYYQQKSHQTGSKQPHNNQLNSKQTNTQTNKLIKDNPLKRFGKSDDFANYDWIDKTPRCSGRWVYPKQPKLNQLVTQNTQHSQQTQRSQKNLLLSQADYGYYADKNYAELRGNVIVQNNNPKGVQTVQADHIRVDVNSKDIYAEGNVLYADGNSSNASPADSKQWQQTEQYEQAPQENTRLKDGSNGLITVADKLTFNPDSKVATAQAVAFANVPLQAHGYAGKLSKYNDNQYQLDNVMLTTCPPDDIKWQVNAKKIVMDPETGRGKLRGSTLKIKEVPVLYLPYFNFPIDDRRTSGFLVPHLSTSDGFALDIPYYLNLAPNYDATITPKIYNNRNPLITSELRYLTDKYGRGRIVNSFLSKDKQYDNKNRSSVFYNHEWQSKKTPELTANLEYNYVSDSDYFADFDSLGTRNNTLNLSRQANVNYYNDRLSAQLKLETFQSLDAFDIYGKPIADKDKPYSRYPQLLVNYNAPVFKDWQVSVVHDSAYFKQNINDNSAPEKSGLRVYNKVKTSIPLQKSWGYITPEASIQHIFSQYDQDSLEALSIPANGGTSSALVPQIGVDAGLHFFQAGPPTWWANQNAGGYQLLNPRLKYTYSPYQVQNDIPNFDTRIATVTYDQLFADSWFLGHDRIQDLHALTPGVNYRYIDATGLTRLDASIGSQFYLDSGRVTLDDSVIDAQHPAIKTDSNRLFDDGSSGIVTTLSSQPYKNWWIDVNGALNSNNSLSYLTTQVRYQPNPYSLFNVGFVKRKLDKNTNQLPLTATTVAATFPLNKNWRLLAQGQYNWQNRKLFDGLMGLDYEDCCMGFSLYSRRYYNELNPSAPPKTSFMAELRLNGLGQSAGDLARTMSNKVLGFDKVDQQWKR